MEYEKKKKLSRSEDNKRVMGVAGGLAEHFNIDATIVRLLFVVLAIAGGPGILIYIILAFLMSPAGSSASDILSEGFDSASVAFDKAADAASNAFDQAAEPVDSAEDAIDTLKQEAKSDDLA